MIYDIAIIGSGPNGDALACALADSNLKIAIIDKQPLKKLENPIIDGRDIALTHRSINMLKEIGFWNLIPNNLISKINKAKIFDGDSTYSLNFENINIKKDNLGCLIPNFLIKKNLKKLLKKAKNIFSIESEIIDFYNEGDFNSEVEKNFNLFFGKMHLIGKRYSYPMITVYSKKFISNRFALIGDAAVGMHPVTAHGFNLGLQGIKILTKEIKSAVKNNIDIGSNFVLNKFQYKLHLAAIPLYLATNSIVRLYTNTSKPSKMARKFALRAVNAIKPLKKAFMNVLE